MIISLAVVLCGKLGLGICHYIAQNFYVSVYTEFLLSSGISVHACYNVYIRTKNDLEAQTEPSMCASFEVNNFTNDKQVPASYQVSSDYANLTLVPFPCRASPTNPAPR